MRIFYHSIQTILACLIIVSISAPIWGHCASLKWDPVNQATGYIIYYTDLGTGVTYNKDVGGQNTYPLEGDLNLQPGNTYEFYVTCYNDAMESDPSNKVEWTRPVFSPPADNLPDIVITIPQGTNAVINIINE